MLDLLFFVYRKWLMSASLVLNCNLDASSKHTKFRKSWVFYKNQHQFSECVALFDFLVHVVAHLTQSTLPACSQKSLDDDFFGWFFNVFMEKFIQQQNICWHITDLYMKVSSIFVINVIIKLYTSRSSSNTYSVYHEVSAIIVIISLQ